MSYFQTAIYIISFNRLKYLSQLVGWLEDAGYNNIHIIDNNSTYPPLLEYLSRCPHNVHRMDRNYGHLVLWNSGRFNEKICHDSFVLSDCDVVPAESCPDDVVERLARVLDRYPNFTKAGLSLKIDDLPDWYAPKAQVLAWEAQFWDKLWEADDIYEAAIDTTFAYYRPGIAPDNADWWRSLRTAPPLTARHLPWYTDTSSPSDEDIYYQSRVAEMSSQWSVTDPLILKEQNIRLQAEIHTLRKEIAILQQRLTGARHAVSRSSKINSVGIIGLRKIARRLRRLKGGAC